MRFNVNGIPIAETEQEKQNLNKAMLKFPCGCGAKSGERCVQPRPRTGKRILVREGMVHLGRLPAGFDTADAIQGKYK